MGAPAKNVIKVEKAEVKVEETEIIEEVDLKELAKELIAEMAIKLEVLEVTLASM